MWICKGNGESRYQQCLKKTTHTKSTPSWHTVRKRGGKKNIWYIGKGTSTKKPRGNQRKTYTAAQNYCADSTPRTTWNIKTPSPRHGPENIPTTLTRAKKTIHPRRSGKRGFNTNDKVSSGQSPSTYFGDTGHTVSHVPCTTLGSDAQQDDRIDKHEETTSKIHP